jgi:PEGA domain
VRHEPIELLCLRSELTSVPSFEFALRERVSHLSTFRHGCYAHVRSVERLKNPPGALVLVSDVTAGVRLSEVLAFAEHATVPLDIDAALCLLRQIVPAVAMLHEEASDVAHGAIAPERIIVTPAARIVMVEHTLGAALGELQYSRERYWKELRVALPGTGGPASFDHRSDAAQLGAVALSLILGRPLADDELPSRLGEVVASSWAISARGGLEPLPAGLRAWLMRALQLDPRESFESAVDALEELERVLGDSDYMASPASLEAFLAHYRAETGTPATPAAANVWAPERTAEPIRQADPAPAPMPTSDPAPMPSSPTMSSSRPASAPYVEAYNGHPLAGAQAPHIKPADVRPADIKPAEKPVRPSEMLRPAEPKPPAPAPYVSPHEQTFGPMKTGDHKAADFKTPEVKAADVRTPDAKTLDQKPTPAPARAIAPPIDFSSFPAQADEDVFKTPPSSRRWWPAVAAVVVVALAGVAVPTVRRMVSPSPVATDGTLSVTTNPPGAHLFVDGVERGVTPTNVALKPGPHSLEVRGDGAPRLLPITITAGAQLSQYLELPKAAAAVGQLNVRTEPAGARVSIDGVSRGAAPVMVSELAPGEHSVVVESDLGTVKQTVTVEAGVTASLTVPLAAAEGAPVSGWLSVSAPADVQIFENKRLVGSSQTDRLMVTAGRHELEIVNDALGYRAVRTVQVPAGKVTPVKIEFPKGTIALNALPWAEVWVDGEKVGETPIGNLQVTIGTHDIVFRNPDLGELRQKATVTLTAPARLSVDLRKK